MIFVLLTYRNCASFEPFRFKDIQNSSSNSSSCKFISNVDVCSLIRLGTISEIGMDKYLKFQNNNNIEEKIEATYLCAKRFVPPFWLLQFDLVEGLCKIPKLATKANSLELYKDWTVGRLLCTWNWSQTWFEPVASIARPFLSPITPLALT